MYELAKWIWEHRNQPITWATALSFLWLILDKLGRKLINSQLKRLFRIRQKSEFAKYIENQNRIEAKVDLLLEERGLKWGAVETTSSKSITQTAKNSSLFGWVTAYHAVTARLRTTARHSLSRNTGIKQSSLVGRKQTMTKDLLSGKKKFVAFIIAVLVNGLNDVLGLGLSGDTLETTTYISGGFIVIEGVLDVVRALSNHFLKKNNTGVASNEEFKTSTEHFE